jgi:hypothetical protein
MQAPGPDHGHIASDRLRALFADEKTAFCEERLPRSPDVGQHSARRRASRPRTLALTRRPGQSTPCDLRLRKTTIRSCWSLTIRTCDSTVTATMIPCIRPKRNALPQPPLGQTGSPQRIETRAHGKAGTNCQDVVGFRRPRDSLPHGSISPIRKGALTTYSEQPGRRPPTRFTGHR